MPSALIIQHEVNGPAALVAAYLERHGYTLHTLPVMNATSTYSDVAFPDPGDFDLIVPTGSVQSVYDEQAIGSWIGREVGLLRRAHESGIPVFGICFGAQSLCVALGGTVERAPSFEIGWIEVDTDDPAVVPPGPWFTWHDDRCLPPSTVDVLARSAVAVQAFRSGSSMAVQFHPEVDRRLVETWLEAGGRRLLDGRGIDPLPLLEGFARHGAVAEASLRTMLDRFRADVGR